MFWRLLIILAVTAPISALAIGEKDSGYRGIWYCNQTTNDEYVYKYSGGLGTYCSNHIPMAIYAPQVEKTFFVYGGAKEDKNTLIEMVSCYDHKTGQVPRPTSLLDKKTEDAHDNPVLSIDSSGYLWVFASAHGTSRPAYIFRSQKPYDIDAFDQILETNFSYPQPWYVENKGFFFLHTHYEKGHRVLFWMTSPDGKTWSERHPLAHIDQGHYQVSWPGPGKIGSCFDFHPKDLGLNSRTNLYYVETTDFGNSWHAADGAPIETPITSINSPALVHNYQAEGLLMYGKDLKFDSEGRPVFLHVTSKGWKPGPAQGPHTWRIAHWTGSAWEINAITESGNNYDSGALYIESDGLWRVIGPTETGPQPYNPGGEIAVWTSRDKGEHWTKEEQLTFNSEFNHTYVRSPLNANPGFYAFWADGHGRKPSPSRLYFYDKTRDTVFRLPSAMVSTSQPPQPVIKAIP
ncbi:MAG TPA: BNR-4 repeat-containing protein [Candidatus Hydrogenedentes bacterium]|nr:BNR-4 repeat-containing protein [Candidatus Hydrogenedentota bacterium]